MMCRGVEAQGELHKLRWEGGKVWQSFTKNKKNSKIVKKIGKAVRRWGKVPQKNKHFQKTSKIHKNR